MRLQKTVTVERPLDKAFAYLSDFATTTEGDPGTVRTVRIRRVILQTAHRGCRVVSLRRRPLGTGLTAAAHATHAPPVAA